MKHMIDERGYENGSLRAPPLRPPPPFWSQICNKLTPWAKRLARVGSVFLYLGKCRLDPTIWVTLSTLTAVNSRVKLRVGGLDPLSALQPLPNSHSSLKPPSLGLTARTAGAIYGNGLRVLPCPSHSRPRPGSGPVSQWNRPEACFFGSLSPRNWLCLEEGAPLPPGDTNWGAVLRPLPAGSGGPGPAQPGSRLGRRLYCAVIWPCRTPCTRETWRGCRSCFPRTAQPTWSWSTGPPSLVGAVTRGVRGCREWRAEDRGPGLTPSGTETPSA